MGEFPLHISNEPSFNEDLGLVMAVFESGHSVELSATGYSMFPTFSPGVRVVVRAVSRGERLVKGDVVVCLDNGIGQDIFVMHRLVEIKCTENGEIFYITRGDSRQKVDSPWNEGKVVGVVSGQKTKHGLRRVKSFVPGRMRLGFNRMMLWVYWKLMRLTSLMFRV